jgi:hypothetical protein
LQPFAPLTANFKKTCFILPNELYSGFGVSNFDDGIPTAVFEGQFNELYASTVIDATM